MGNPSPTPTTVPPPAESTMMNNINENNDHNEVDPEKSAASVEPTELKAVKKAATPNWVNQGTNVVLIICISAMTLCLRSDMISVTRRGFYCDDMSIRYPIRPETISTKVLIIASVLLAAVLFSVTEYFILKQNKFLTTSTVSLVKKSFQVPAWLSPALRLLLTYFMGAAANSILTDIAKNVIGWPRPNFWETCQPNVTCSDNANRYVYITQFKCLNGKYYEVNVPRCLSTLTDFDKYVFLFNFFQRMKKS